MFPELETAKHMQNDSISSLEDLTVFYRQDISMKYLAISYYIVVESILKWHQFEGALNYHPAWGTYNTLAFWKSFLVLKINAVILVQAVGKKNRGSTIKQVMISKAEFGVK